MLTGASSAESQATAASNSRGVPRMVRSPVQITASGRCSLTERANQSSA
jgi:hypothetical protein